MTCPRARRGLFRLVRRSPRRGADGGRGCKGAFDVLLFPRVPLRYALPGPSRGSGRMWASAPTKDPAGNVSVGADTLIGPCRGPHRPPVQRQRVQEQGPCDFSPRRPPRRTRGTRPRQMSGPARAGRRPAGLVGTDSEDPCQRGGTKVPERGKKAAFSFGPAAARFLFRKTEKKMGGGGHYRLPVNSSPNGALSPISHTFRKLVI